VAKSPKEDSEPEGPPSGSESPPDDSGSPPDDPESAVGAGFTPALDSVAPTEPEPEPEPDHEPYRAGWFFDNPSVGRALRYTFADKRLARAVFVNALLLVVGLAATQEAFGRGQLGLFSERISFGRIAFLGLIVVEAAVISILAPLGSMYLFEAERREECFDQVVASGVSPHRVVFGRFVATLAFLGVVLFSSLPFLATAVVLDGATLSQVATAYMVLASYGVALSALSLACAVGFDDVALPVLLAVVATFVAVVVGFGRRAVPVFAAWSPVRHVTLDLADIARDLHLGVFVGPAPFGVELPCEVVSLGMYAVATFVGLVYAFVGPDLELTEGLDSFDSVTVSRKVEATRARRGIARSLLRTVQLRFFYENLGPRARALSPFLRNLVTLVLFVVGHVVFLSAFWPHDAPQTYRAFSRGTVFPYVSFTFCTLGLLALLGAGGRAALFARSPVARLRPVTLTRFATLFLVFGFALTVPALIWSLATAASGYPAAVMHAPEVHGLYLLTAGYAAFAFSLALLLAMLTTNPYSATGWSLIAVFATNLIPAIWIPLFTGNLAGEGSSFLLDLSPLSAGMAIARPGDQFPFRTFRGDELVHFSYETSWQPFFWFHLALGLGCLIVALILARRQLRQSRARFETVGESEVAS